MPTLKTTLTVYDPVSRADRARKVTVEGPQLLLDCLDRDASCLDLQMLAEAADGAPSREIALKVTIAPIKRRRGWR